MKSKIAVILMMFSVMSMFAQVDSSELESVQGNDIQFENFTGTYQYRESIFSIMGIGRRLSNGLKSSDSQQYKYLDKYSIIHCVDDNEGKHNADIISIDPDARVEHIRNVRLIISSYLTAQYGYSSKDAKTLAYFISIYNAVYRGKIEMFAEKYNQIVLKNITADNAGLPLRYYEWPGNTKIVIPLTIDPKKGNLSSLSTTELSTGDVVAASKSEEDMSLDERKDLVDIKEKEVLQQENKLQKDKDAIEKKEKSVKKSEQSVAEKKQDVADKEASVAKQEDAIAKKEASLAKEQSELETKEKEISEMEDGPEKDKAMAELAKEKEELAKEKEEVASAKEELAEEKAEVEAEAESVAKDESDLEAEKEKLEQEKDATDKKQEAISDKKEEIKEDKKEIAQDEREKLIEENEDKAKDELKKQSEELAAKEEALDKREAELSTNKADPRIFAGRFYYLKVKEYMDGGHYNNQLAVIDGATRKVVAESSYNSICGKNYYVFKEGIVVIGHKDSSDTSHYLVLIDPDTLDVKKMGEDNIFQRSVVEIRDGFIYAVVKGKNAYHLAKFDMNLEMVSMSEPAVFNDTFLSFYDDVIYMNDANKQLLILDKTTLKPLLSSE